MTEVAQKAFASCVAGDFLGSRVRRSIDFDDQLFLAANKIRIKRPNRFLPNLNPAKRRPRDLSHNFASASV
jgi:hypothetical protein